MQVLKVIDERQVGLYNVETGELIDELSSRTTPAAADEYIEGQINLFENEGDHNESNSSN